MNKIIHSVLSLFLLLSFLITAIPQTTLAQTPAQTNVSADLKNRLAAIEEKIEARRKELGIPGMSLAIVKDGEVILSKGFGYKDFSKQIPVTADTQFAIGSATKAFTALSVLMSQDEGKLLLDEHPNKYLPYFKINDAETNAKIKVRNLLTHSSGLNRTDLGWITGKLTREETIKVAGEAKPVAKLGEKFLYQNVMYAAAGEIVSKVQKMTWENYVAQNILKPIGMLDSSISIPEMQKAKDYSLGYEYNFDTKATKLMPTRELAAISPAGAINSTANDMAKWLKFLLSKGEVGGKKLVSEKGFAEWTTAQQNISPNGKFAYAMGWFVQELGGKKVLQHGGNIDGFNSMVAFMPDENIGFVMLTNVSASSLGSELIPIIFDGILKQETPQNTAVSADSTKEIGVYNLAAANLDIEIKMQDGKLVAIVPGQPTYTLEMVEGRKYKLGGAPAGFFITFKDDSALLEQPQGNVDLTKKGAVAKTAISTASAKELIGKYRTPDGKGAIEIKEVDGKTSLVVGNQPAYPLVEKEKDVFGSTLLPDTYKVKVNRTNENKVEGVTVVQPEGEFVFKYVGESEKTADAPKITVDELIAKTIEALGGETNLRKINSRVMEFDVDFVNQGLKGYGTSYSKAPNMSSSKINVTALGKKIATVADYFDGASGGEIASFAPADIYTGQRLEDTKYSANFYTFLEWKTAGAKAEVIGMEKVEGEDAYAVRIKPEKANAVTYFISAKTFLPVKQTSVVVSSTSDQKIPTSATMSDYRKIDGVMIPFKVSSENIGTGETVLYVKSIKHNTDISDKQLKP